MFANRLTPQKVNFSIRQYITSFGKLSRFTSSKSVVIQQNLSGKMKIEISENGPEPLEIVASVTSDLNNEDFLLKNCVQK